MNPTATPTSTNRHRDTVTDTPQPQPRRPRGFAASSSTAAATTTTTTTSSSSASTGKNRREREKEKERTKLRERHRRAITSRMLAGLRQHGNFPLPARADMNDVLAALAREAGWTVEPDGTTYRQSAPPSQLMTSSSTSLPPPPRPPPPPPITTAAAAIRSVEGNSLLRIDESLSPSSLDSIVVNNVRSGDDKFSCVECLDADQLIQDVHSGDHDNGFKGTKCIPVYMMLPTGFINNFCQLVDPQGLREELSQMKSLNADGVVVDCWWGIVEAWEPQKYVWSGYRELFSIIRKFKLKLQVVMAFHECGAIGCDDVLISLPQWILEIGKDNPDIFFTDHEGRRNTECLSWGIDRERVLKGRTSIEVYFDFMRNFRVEFDDLFAEGLVSAVEIGLGPSGELRYPSFPVSIGWRYPGIGQFQCYDKYLQQNLLKAAKLRGHLMWAKGPDNTGQYNSKPHETGFFCERGEYDSYYGRFFLHWYSQLLIGHADDVLSIVSLLFDDAQLVIKIPAVYWWYRTASHAAELTAGYYNSRNQNGYSPLFEVLKKYSVTIKCAFSGLRNYHDEHDEAFADPEGLSWQVLTSAYDRGLTVAGVNMLSSLDREGYSNIIEMAKPRNDQDGHNFLFFVYQHPSPLVQGTFCLSELDYFIKRMHGEVSDDFVVD